MDVVTWTPERVEQLTQLFEEGLPTAEIGRRLGLTKNAVIGKLHRIALAPRVSTPVAPPQRNFFEFNGPSCLWPYGHPTDENFHFCGARPLPAVQLWLGPVEAGHHGLQRSRQRPVDNLLREEQVHLGAGHHLLRLLHLGDDAGQSVQIRRYPLEHPCRDQLLGLSDLGQAEAMDR